MAKKPETHEFYMQLALDEAKKAGQKGEVPIGAILVAKDGEILAAACNSTISLSDPSAHAEIIALRKAGNKLRNYRLLDTILYVTTEPCLMCMGAIVHARLKSVVFGTYDPKWGAAGSLYNFAEDGRLNHRTDIISGVLEEECRALIKEFFRTKREYGKQNIEYRI
jgi:tRNA(adenine34) deaminase